MRETIEALLESFPQTVFQLILVLGPAIQGAELHVDPILISSVMVSFAQAYNYFVVIKGTAEAYRRPKRSIVWELLNISDPLQRRVPFRLLLRRKHRISYIG